METKVDFKKIKDRFKRGAINEISRKAGVTSNTVQSVLNSKSSNVKVLNAIADYLEDQDGKEKQALDRISSFIK